MNRNKNPFLVAQQDFLLQCFPGKEQLINFTVAKDGATVIAVFNDGSGAHTDMWTFCSYINPRFCVDTYLADY